MVAYPEVTVDEELFHSSPSQDIVTSVPLLLLSGSGQEVNLLGPIKIAMSDVQNFFLEALAVIFVKVQYLYFRRKLSVSSIRWYQFPVAHSMYAEVMLILIFSHTNFH